MNKELENKFRVLLAGLSKKALEEVFCFTVFCAWRGGTLEKGNATPLQLVRGAWFYYRFETLKFLGRV